MRIGRTLPPAASPIYIRDIINGFRGLIRGEKEIERFRSELRDHYGVKHCFLVSSGKAALTLILKALHDLHPERDEVLIPAFICYSVPSAIVRAGLKVKLCDVNPDTLDYDFNQPEKVLKEYQAKEPLYEDNELSAIRGQDTVDFRRRRFGSDQFHPEIGPEKEISEKSSESCLPCEMRSLFHRGLKNEVRTIPFQNKKTNRRLLAVISAHLFGLPANIDKVRGIVTNPAVTVIEDAAQVLGSTWKDKKLGTLGDVSFFSLGRGKALSTVEGGIIITNRNDIGENIRDQFEEIPGYDILELVTLIFNAILLIVFQHPLFFWFPKSLPFLRVGDTFYDPEFKIRKMTGFQAGLAKKWNCKLYRFNKCRRKLSKKWSIITKSGLIHHYVKLNGEMPDFIRFPVRIDKLSTWRQIIMQSQRLGLGIMFTYPDSVCGIQDLRYAFKNQKFTGAEELAQRLVTLPVHPLMSSKDIKKNEEFLQKIIN